MSTILSNYREGSKFWCRCKGRWMKSSRSLSSLMMRGDNGELVHWRLVGANNFLGCGKRWTCG